MSTLHVKYLLIGGGVAASAAAEAIRRRDGEGDMLLVSQEINRPYRREALRGDYLLRRVGHEGLFTLPANWFNEHHVELRTGIRAVHVDTARQCVTLSDGEEAAFDKLLIATGASPRALEVAGADLPGVLYLRTIEQADTLVHTIDKARQEGRRHARGRGRVVILGHGIDAVELSRTMLELGLEVELVLEGRHLWEGVAGEAVGKRLSRELENQGIVVHATSARSIEGDGRVQRVMTHGGQAIACDLVLAAVGMTANKELLRGTPVAVEAAILADASCRTNVGDIYAAGDCAAVMDRRFGKYRQGEPWNCAEITGRVAGVNMAGGDEVFDDIGVFRGEVFGLTLFACGEPRLVDRRLVRAGEKQFAEIGVAGDGRVAQVIVLGEADAAMESLVHQRVRVNGREEVIKDPHADLQTLF